MKNYSYLFNYPGVNDVLIGKLLQIRYFVKYAFYVIEKQVSRFCFYFLITIGIIHLLKPNYYVPFAISIIRRLQPSNFVEKR